MLRKSCATDRGRFLKAVLIEKSSKLSLGNIGESPINEDNTEISIETKESIPSYSVDLEPQTENIIDPRVSNT